MSFGDNGQSLSKVEIVANNIKLLGNKENERTTFGELARWPPKRAMIPQKIDMEDL
jgi:hypothetical protein